MIKLAQHLSESLSSAFPIERNRSTQSETAATFKDDRGIVYYVSLHHPKDTMEVVFRASDMYLPGYGRDDRARSSSTTLKIYATIGQIIDSALKTHPEISAIKFEAIKSVMIPVYRRLADRIAKQYKGTVQQDDAGRFTIRI